MSDVVLAVRGVTKEFSGVKALDDVNLEIRAGEIHCLAGENGCGKSTLIKVISGVHKPDKGEIRIGDQTFKALQPAEAIKAGIQVIYQDFSVFPNLTVMENLAISSEVANRRKLVNWRRFRKLAQEAIHKINFEVDLDAYLGDLSVADKQLVAICRALLQDAKVLIMDEPTTALTNREVEALFQVIRTLQARGIAILFVSHKLDEVFEISERFTILRNGKLIVTANPAELTRAKFANYMTGHDVDESRFEQPEKLGEELLKLENFGLEGAFSEVNLSLHRGEVLGITGLLGSGRRELALSMFGVFPATSGESRIAGKPVKIDSISQAMKYKIAYVPEDRLTEGLMLQQSIADNIVISTIDDLTHWGWLNGSSIKDAVTSSVESLKIATNNPYNPVSTLSGGNQQRVVLAKWLRTKPDILILNGPTVGVDIGSKQEIHSTLLALARQGMGVIVISDDIPELMQISRRILLLREGKIAGEVDPSTTTEQEVSAMVTGKNLTEVEK